jgi:hypothetical protein
MAVNTWLPSAEMVEHERVEMWRAELLARAGYPTQAAIQLAARADVDVHKAAALLEARCPLITALDILL